MLKRPHTEEEKRNLSKKMKAYLKSLTPEERAERTAKQRQTIKRKEEIVKFFYENLQTINKAVKRERMKMKRDNDDVLNDFD